MDAVNNQPNLRVHIPLDYNANGAKCLLVRGPYEGERSFGSTPVEYSIGVFLSNSYPKMDEEPDIELRVRLGDVIALKNALSAIQIAAGQ